MCLSVAVPPGFTIRKPDRLAVRYNGRARRNLHAVLLPDRDGKTVSVRGSGDVFQTGATPPCTTRRLSGDALRPTPSPSSPYRMYDIIGGKGLFVKRKKDVRGKFGTFHRNTSAFLV